MVKKISDFCMLTLLISLYTFINHNYIPYIAIIMFCLSVGIETLFAKNYLLQTQKKFMGIYSVFYIISLMSYFLSIDQTYTLKAILRLTALFILIIFLSLYYQEDYRVKKTLYYIVLVGVFSYIYILVHPDTNFQKYVGDVIANKNIVGLMLTISFVSAMYLYKSNKRKIYLLVVLFLFSGILLTASRQSIITALFGYVLLSLRINRESKTTKYKNLVKAFFVVLIVYSFLMNNYYLYSIVGYRIENLMVSLFNSSDMADNSISVRNLLAKNGIEWFSKKPFLGYGLDNFKILSLNNYGTPYYAHNNFVEILVDVGLIGFISFYSLYVFVIYSIWVIGERNKWLDESSLLFTLVCMLVFTGIASVHWNRVLYYIVLVLSCSYVDLYRQEVNIKE